MKLINLLAVSMRHQLWLHRDVELLQGMITRYVYSTRWVNKDRVQIEWEWNNIKKDMDKLLKEADVLVASMKLNQKK